MTPNLKIIDTPNEVLGLLSLIKDNDYIAYDTETTGLTTADEVIGYSVCFNEEAAYYVILAKWEKDKLVYNPGVREASITLLKALQNKQLMMHNGLFDCYMTEAYFKVSLIESLHTDTMVLAHLLDENRRVGLKELASQMFGESAIEEQQEMKASILANGGIMNKSQYELYKGDSQLIAKYGAKDAWLTYKIFMELLPQLYEQNLNKFFYEDECMPLLKGPTYQLNTVGLQVDIQALTKLKKTLEAECLEAKAFIDVEIKEHIKDKYPGTNKKNVFNIESSQQLSWLLFGVLNLEFSTLTDGGKTICRALGLKLPYTFSAKVDFIKTCIRDAGIVYALAGTVNGKVVRAKAIKEPWGYIACDKETLKKLSHKYKWIEKLLEYKKKTKILNTYVEGIEERTRYGVIYPQFKQTGTTSGRYSSSNPNFQNLPRDDKRIKQCIVPRPGKVFVGADYSQLEPRVFAYYSNDERLLQAFKGQDDFYSVIGMEIYGKTDCTPRKDGSPDAFGIKYKRLRDLSKVIALASTYGATAHQLAPTTGKSIEDTKADIDNYFETFPGVANMMLEAHKLARTNGVVENLFGRPRRMPEAKRIDKIYGPKSHAELPYEARKLLNLAVNHRIQSTGASIVNRAMIKFFNDTRDLAIDCKIVVQVHDSIVVECDKKDEENVSLLLQEAMEYTTILKGINLEAVPKTGINLGEV